MNAIGEVKSKEKVAYFADINFEGSWGGGALSKRHITEFGERGKGVIENYKGGSFADFSHKRDLGEDIM